MQPTGRTSILIVDDDPIVAGSLADMLAGDGHATAVAADAPSALAALARAEAEAPAPDQTPRPVEVVICDLNLPGEDGLGLLRKIADQHPATAVIMLTGYSTVETAVKALKLGAVDYLTKPVVDAELRQALERAIRQQALLAENRSLRRRLHGRVGLDHIIGTDPRMIRVFDMIDAVAAGRTTVLMTGESGVGKSLIAHAIHHRSPRRAGPFVELACGSIPETLLESELFGHAKGAFTGAYADKAGRFLAAHGGTIFLDEINSASPGLQLKLLRVLQERRFEPVGSTRTVEADVRVVLATNQPLEQLVAAGQFRQDLYYRINVVAIEIPPLRDRVGDIEMLANHFLRDRAAELSRQFAGFSPRAMDALRRYRFPGNVRELANIVERAAVLSRSPTIDLADLPEAVANPPTPPTPAMLDDDPWSPMTLEQAMREPERRVLLKALAANQWNRQKTADQLGINRTTLYKKLKALGIDPAVKAAG